MNHELNTALRGRLEALRQVVDDALSYTAHGGEALEVDRVADEVNRAARDIAELQALLAQWQS